MANQIRSRAIALATAIVMVMGSPSVASANVDGLPTVIGPLPGTVPGDRLADRLEDTYATP